MHFLYVIFISLNFLFFFLLSFCTLIFLRWYFLQFIQHFFLLYNTFFKFFRFTFLDILLLLVLVSVLLVLVYATTALSLLTLQVLFCLPKLCLLVVAFQQPNVFLLFISCTLSCCFTVPLCQICWSLFSALSQGVNKCHIFIITFHFLFLKLNIYKPAVCGSKFCNAQIDLTNQILLRHNISALSSCKVISANHVDNNNVSLKIN